MNTRQRDPTGIASELNGLIGGLFSSRAVDGAVHTAPPCPIKDFLNSFCGLKHGVGADSSGQLAAVCQGAYGSSQSAIPRGERSAWPHNVRSLGWTFFANAS